MATQTSSKAKRTRLSDSLISKLFSELQGNYGSRFVNMWRIGQSLADGQDAGMVNAKAHWAERLGVFSDSDIAYALRHLPANPPTLPEFAELCRLAPRQEQASLPHKLTPEQVEINRQRINEIARKYARSHRLA